MLDQIGRDGQGRDSTGRPRRRTSPRWYKYSGGVEVKASTLNAGDYIRHPKRNQVILQVKETGSEIFAEGITPETGKYHIFLRPETGVVKVTQVETEDIE